MTKEKARNPKHEARNKLKMMKNKTTAMLQTGRIEFTVLDFLILNSFWPRFVSDFVLRISDLFRWLLEALNLFEVVLFNISKVRI
jgi:hypothetical protein